MGKYYSETIQKGSTGDSVKEWQKYLNTQGYSLGVDGIFGDKTLAATKEYQQKNGIGVDGIVGEKTWGKAGYTNINSPVSAPTTNPMPTAPTYDSTSYDQTQTGKDALGKYNTALDAYNNYGPYQYSQEELYKAVMDKILNREDFTYDFNGDALYQQYKDKYIKQGKMAMGDAIGQASAMTGGYGNSYAQSVGQQAYQAQLENLNDIVPELWQAAYDQYRQEGQELYNQFSMLGTDRDRAYGEWNDGYNKVKDALGIARSDYYDGADMFYTEQSNKNSVAGQQFSDAMSIWQNETDNAWKQAEWDENQRRYEKESAYTTTSSSSGGSTGGSSGSGNGSGGTGYDNGGYEEDVVKKIQSFVGAGADGKWGPNSTAKAKAKGYNSIDEAYAAMLKAKGYDGGTAGDTKSFKDFDVNTYQQYVNDIGGSYYGSALTRVKAMQEAGKSTEFIRSYLQELVGMSLLSQGEYITLMQKTRK